MRTQWKKKQQVDLLLVVSFTFLHSSMPAVGSAGEALIHRSRGSLCQRYAVNASFRIPAVAHCYDAQEHKPFAIGAAPVLYNNKYYYYHYY